MYIISIARIIFIFDNIDYIPDIKNINETFNVSLRQKVRVYQFRISLLSQEFELKNIILDENKVDVDLFDLQKDGNLKNRIIHCKQLLYNVWKTWEIDLIYINYYNFEHKKYVVLL